MTKKVALSTKKELEIYMNPVRQRLLRILDISREPMTPKMLADKLQISASSVQHHIKKLQTLDLVELDHTKLINGITASYYRSTNATVQVGLDLSDESVHQREILLQEEIARTFNGFVAHRKKLMSRHKEMEPETLQKWGEIVSGVMHLTEEEGQELIRMITEYLKDHTYPTEERYPWEFALILYNAREDLEP